MDPAQARAFLQEGRAATLLQDDTSALPDETITSPAYKDDKGGVHIGPDHLSILKQLGIPGFESRDSRRTPNFGFVTSKGRFVTRPEAAPLIEKSGQKIADFDTDEAGTKQPHSDEVQFPSLSPALPEDITALPRRAAQPRPADILRSSLMPPGVPDIVAERSARYLRETQEPGIPLDVQTGASPWERLLVGSMRDKNNALTYLQNKYGAGNVRLDETGDFIFRITDDDGKSKDVKFDPEGVSLGDFAALASAIPEVAGTIFSISRGRAIPTIGKAKGLAGLTRDVLFGAAGGEAAGALKDIAATTVEQGPATAIRQIPEIAAERGKMAVGDIGLGAGTYGLGRFFKFAGAPFAGKRGPVQFAAKEAQDYFANNPRYGIKVPLTASEMTGSPILGRAEVYTEIQPGGFGPLRALKESQEKELLGLQRQITGIAPPVADKEILDRVSHGFATELSGLEEATRTTQRGISDSAEAQILSDLNELNTARRQLYRSLVGQQARASAMARRTAEMDRANELYEQARQIHGLEDKNFDAKPLQNRLEKILSELPAVKTTEQKPTGLFGEFGEPLTQTVEATKTLEKWPPERLLPRLKEILSQDNPRVSYWDLKNMRRDVYDDLTKSEGVPSMGTHYLVQIGQAITDTMNDVKNQISRTTPGFGKAIEAADKQWKERVVPFDRPGISEWFRRTGETGYIPDDEIVTRIFTTAKTPSVSIQNWNLAKETLGEKSVAWQNIKRSFLDHLIESNRLSDQTIDARGLVESLQNLRTKYREIFDETVGPKFNSLLKESRFVEAGKDLGKTQPKISQQDLSALLADSSPTAAKLGDAVKAQLKLDETYRNDLLRMAIPREGVNPSEFVDRLVSSPKTSPEQLAQILQKLAGLPALLEDIQTKALERFFQAAGRRAGPLDVSRSFAGETSSVASNLGMVRYLESDPAMAKKLQLLLGPERFRDLNQFANLVAGTEYKYAAGGYTMAGAFAATHAVKALEQLKFLQFAKPAVANWFVAKMLVNPAFRAWAARTPRNPDPGYFSLFLTSPAFLREVSHDFPGNSASAFVSEVKDGLDQFLWHQKETQATPSPSDEQERRRFFQNYLRQRRTQ